jgi:hypothetical protein
MKTQFCSAPRLRFRWAIGLVVALASAGAAKATDIPPGDDCFTTPPGMSSLFNFSGVPIPAGFFEPGSDPFQGTIQLGGTTGTTDTLVRRLQSATLPGPPSSATIPIELVSLNLVSVNPITVTYNGGQNPQLWNVQVLLDPARSSLGQMMINETVPQGGTFSSFFHVFPELRFSPLVGGGATLPLLREDTLSQPISTWSHTAPSGVLPSTNNFYPGGLPGNTSVLNHVFYQGGQLHLELVLTTVPEPSTLILGSLAMLGLGFWCWRQRKRHLPSRSR